MLGAVETAVGLAEEGDQLALGRRSCEQLAEAVAARIDLTWPGRQITVAVYEDNEVGATIPFQGEP